VTDKSVRAIVGPTGAGKSALAMQFARNDRDVEIVAVDAFTVYRGMDIATAKPSRQDRAEVPHHMIDVLDPDRAVDVKWFQSVARTAISDIHARGRGALLVGGSGLYFRAVVDDLRFPPTDPAVRRRLTDRWAEDPPAAHAHLATIDPSAAAKIEPDNLRRTVRALEVIELTGEPFSSFRDAWDDHASVYANLEVTYVEPPTSDLRGAITERSHAMVAAGLLDEAADLRRRFPDGLSRTAAQAIGYAEAFAVLDGDADPSDLADAIARRTWSYARRQRSWFRRDPRCMVPSARPDGTMQQPRTL
jgi:tRNA dimethylallyltransferase